MATPHIGANKGDIAETILLPGDPLRAKYIAETFLENVVQYNNVRGMLGFTGTYKGKKVSVQGTGMGVPSIGIYAHELIAEFGVKNLIRIGTAGSYQKNVKIRDVVLAMSASTDSAINKLRFNGAKETKDSKMQISNTLSTTNYLSRENIAREMGFQFNDINEILSNDMGYGMSFPKYARLDRKAQAASYDRHIYPLSGFTKGDEAKVTIIGKLRGYDPNFTSEQLSDLKNFINESKGLFVEYIQGQQAKPDNDKPKILRDTPYTVNEFLNEYRGDSDLLFMQNSRTINLLDSDMSVDEFKEEWAKYVLKERFDLTLSGEDAKNAVNILKELNEKGI